MAPKNKKDTSTNTLIADNRKARHNYEFIETLEAGLMLTGTEVKSLRNGQANIAESYATEENGEIWLINSYIPEYLEGNRNNHNPRRHRKLLLQKDAKRTINVRSLRNVIGIAKKQGSCAKRGR